MSLQELSGPSIHLKLSIREGHGFGFLKSPIVIVAGTNGIFLETEVVPPSPDPLFHIDLVWETDKRNLRRFRASNTPMKLECFTVGPSNQRDCIGSILLNIKSAQVLPRGSLNNVNEKWHKLIGVPAEAKALQPELLLSLTIQEPNSLSQPLPSSIWEGRSIPPTIVLPDKQTEAADSRNAEKSRPSNPASTLPAPELKQGCIQLGSECSSIDLLLLNFTVKHALELELLLRGYEKFCDVDSNLKPFQIAFTLMGHSFQTKLFGDKSPGPVCTINEEVVLPIRTSLSVLHQYLQEKPCALVSLFYLGQEIAAAELHIRSLVPTNDMQSFAHEFNGLTSFSQKCKLVSSRSRSFPVHGGVQPSVEITTKLQLAASQATPHQAQQVTNQTKLMCDNLSFPSCIVSQDTSSRSESRQSHDTFIVTSQNGPVWIPVAPGLTQTIAPTKANCGPEDEIIKLGIDQDISAGAGAPVTPENSYLDHSLRIGAGKTAADPKALQNAKLAANQLGVSSFHSLNKEASKSCTAMQETTLPVVIAVEEGQAIKSKCSKGDAIQHPPQQSSITSKSPEINCVPARTLVEIEPTMPLDTSTAYKIVEELEDWKEKQQEIFLAELKQKEVEHLARVTEEWTRKVKAQNTELENKVEECKAMANTLSSAKQDLKDRLKTCSTREQELRKAKESLDMQYQIKFQELTLAAQRLDEGVKLKVALVESKCSKLEIRLKELESENETLRHELNQKASAAPANQTCGMSHKQVSQLITQVDQLEGKLNESLQSKAYFKEQWGRAVREMNQAKLQFSQSSENSKCLENLLNKEETELQRDQRTLENLRQELAYFNSH
ncbi:centrosomal protein of 120 kDa isoform X2 [Thrips palmi]|uniref:Centrosomal protein of 120 kDa isoform X2 n=1 Tax=Thrips palmi TaxID=161013 RepID=A0A6P8YQ16_THRPL|nr:centrosomal protein of 120 kDa isoform X2 [Thrips palmi]